MIIVNKFGGSLRNLVYSLFQKKRVVTRVTTPVLTPTALTFLENAANNTILAQFNILNGAGTYSFTATGLPAGLALAANGSLTKTATINVQLDTTTNVTITATNGAGSTVSIVVPIKITDVVGTPIGPSYTMASMVHINGGTASVGNGAMYMSGSYAGAPFPTESWVWQRRINNGTWTTIASSDNLITYIFKAADLGYEIRAFTTLTNPTATINFASIETLGPIVAGTDYTTITAPVVANTGPTNVYPYVWTTTIDNSVVEGDIWHLQVARDSNFTTILYDGRKMVSPQDFDSTSFADWSASAFPPPYLQPFTTPTGTFFLRMKVERFANVFVESNWSNVITATITVSVAQLTNATTFNKNLYALVTGNPPLEFTSNGGQYYNVQVRSTIDAVNNYFQFEITFPLWNTTRMSEAGMGFNFDIEQGTVDLRTTDIPLQNKWSLGLGATNIAHNYWNGTYGDFAVLYNEGVIAADIYTVRIHKTNKTLELWRKRAGTRIKLFTINEVPVLSNFYLTLGGSAFGTDYFQAKVNYGATPFDMPLDNGAAIYG